MSKAVQKAAKSASPAAESKAESAHGTLSGQEMMDAVLSKPSQIRKRELSGNRRISGIVIGRLSEIEENGQPRVHYDGIACDESLAAISTERLTDQDIGCEVALSFVEGNPSRPVILGLIQNPEIQEQSGPDKEVDVRLDGEKLTLTADREITLRCGKSSITLTRAGKIIIKGAYLSNYSTGVNRIKGGSVQIN